MGRRLCALLTRTNAAPAIAAFAATLALLAPQVHSLDQHPDEAQYGWSAAYFSGLVVRGDFRHSAENTFSDPGWHPYTYWSSATGMGARFVYGAALGATGTDAPTKPYSYTDPKLQGSETLLSPRALTVLRYAAIICAAFGLALVCVRLGWYGLVAIVLLLAIAHVRSDLARAWAEGPLFLGLGMCVASFRTRFFPIACAVAATFKMTALALWPLTLHRKANGGLRALKAGLLVAGTWTLLTPQSWPLLGVLDLPNMIGARGAELQGQSTHGLFFPSRYYLPLEFAGAIVLALVLRRATHFAHARGRLIKARRPTPTT
jgi:hypothetical protein